MKTKTTGIPFKDYGADTTAGTEVIKPQHAEYKRTRGPENPSSLLFANVNARLQIVYDVFQQSPAEKKGISLAFTSWHIVSFIQLSNCQSLPSTIFTREMFARRSKSTCNIRDTKEIDVFLVSSTVPLYVRALWPLRPFINLLCLRQNEIPWASFHGKRRKIYQH